MTEQEALIHRVDRTGFPKGEWDKEPDRVDFEHAGYACLLLRNSLGNWCGYVGVPLNHPVCQMDAANILEVHGGITYSGICSPPICHVPQPGMPVEVRWFGFDCAHSGDLTPGMYRLKALGPPPDFLHYWNAEEAQNETKQLAVQLARIELQGAAA